MLRIRNILPVSKSDEDAVFASFVILLESDKGVQQYWAEARKCPNAEVQIDWSDDLSDLLSEFHLVDEAYDYINKAVFSTFLGKRLEYPINLSVAT